MREQAQKDVEEVKKRGKWFFLFLSFFLSLFVYMDSKLTVLFLRFPVPYAKYRYYV